MTPRLPAHRITTAHLGAAYPFQADRGLTSRGVLIGRDLHSGGNFYADGWEWYAAGVVTNPGMIVLGEIGAGKSALLKSLAFRQLVFGRQCWFLDPKGEYTRLCAAVGVEPVHLQPGGDVRLNPLDPRVGGDEVPREQVRDAQLQILQAVAAAALGRALSSEEQGACAEALREVARRWSASTCARSMSRTPWASSWSAPPPGSSGRWIATTAPSASWSWTRPGRCSPASRWRAGCGRPRS
jgi:hypothetical protein